MRISDWSSDVCSSDLSIAAAERAAARSSDPAATFSREMSNRILGNDGIRNRYLQDADNGRATFDITGPLTSLEQNSVLAQGSFSTDIQGSPGYGDSNFMKRCISRCKDCSSQSWFGSRA